VKRITVYVTDEQYRFLLSLRRQKVSTSAFMRGLLASYLTRPAYSSAIAEEEVVVYRKRRLLHNRGVIVPVNEKLAKREEEIRKLRPLLMKELKVALAKIKNKG